MKQEKILPLLKALNSKKTGYRAGWIEAPCPLAPWRHANGKDAHPSFGIKEHPTKQSICKCLSCGFGGDLTDLLFKVHEYQKKDRHEGFDLLIASQLIASELDDVELNPYSLPEYGDHKVSEELVFPEKWLESFKSVTGFIEPMTYLDKRNISAEVIENFDIRYDPIQRRVCFPYRNFKGELMGVQGRAIDKDNELRYYQYGFHGHRNGHVWMGEDKIDFDQPVVVCEGPFDMASIWRVYPNVLASFTSGLSVKKMKRLGDAVEILTFYDFGSGGNAARESLYKTYKHKTPVSHIIPTPEQDDAGNMSDVEVYEALTNVYA